MLEYDLPVIEKENASEQAVLKLASFPYSANKKCRCCCCLPRKNPHGDGPIPLIDPDSNPGVPVSIKIDRADQLNKSQDDYLKQSTVNDRQNQKLVSIKALNKYPHGVFVVLSCGFVLSGSGKMRELSRKRA